MKTNFKSFKTPQEIEQFFRNKVKINSSTPDEVEATLDELGLQHSDLVHIDKSRQVSPNFTFNYVISCAIPARPTMLIFANKWMVYFQFNDDKLLAKIEAVKFSDGI
jgi:hypothetical protein